MCLLDFPVGRRKDDNGLEEYSHAPHYSHSLLSSPRISHHWCKGWCKYVGCGDVTAVLFIFSIAVKVWNNLWQLQWTFIGHCGPVTAISSFCYGPMIVSSSLDATIRVWNLHMQDQIEVYGKAMCCNSFQALLLPFRIQHAFPIQALHCKPGNYSFLSYSKKMVTVWKVRKLYSQTAIIG